LIEQLPGLASLPLGLRFIVENEDLSLAELIIRFLGAQQTNRGSSPVNLSIRRSISGFQINWGNPFVNQAYEIVSAILRRGPVKVFDVTRLEKIDAITLGSQLIHEGGDLDARIKIGKIELKAECKSGLLCRNSLSSYAFVNPEVGYLLAAAVYVLNFAELSFDEFIKDIKLHQKNTSIRILQSYLELAARKQPIVNSDTMVK
jgi:hypothetical protein